jgi:hypothetical protein
MKKAVLIILALALLFTVIGCGKKEDIVEYDYSQSDDNSQSVASDNSDFAQSSKENPDEWNESGLELSEISSIDWNLEAYKTYFRLETNGEVYHYWDMTTCIGFLKDASLVYIHENLKIVIDAISGEQAESEVTFFDGMLPAASDAMMEAPTIPDKPSNDFLYVMVKNPETGLYMLVFDYAQYRISYYISEDLKCIGWGKSTTSSDVNYYFTDNPGYENIVSQYFPEGVPTSINITH